MNIKNALVMLATAILTVVASPSALIGAEQSNQMVKKTWRATTKDVPAVSHSITIEPLKVLFVPVFADGRDQSNQIGLTVATLPEGGVVPVFVDRRLSLRQGSTVVVGRDLIVYSGEEGQRQSYNLATALSVPKTEPEEMTEQDPTEVKVEPLDSRVFTAKMVERHRTKMGTGVALAIVEAGGKRISAALDYERYPGAQKGTIVEVELSEWRVTMADGKGGNIGLPFVIGIAWIKGVVSNKASPNIPRVPYAKQGLYVYTLQAGGKPLR